MGNSQVQVINETEIHKFVRLSILHPYHSAMLSPGRGDGWQADENNSHIFNFRNVGRFWFTVSAEATEQNWTHSTWSSKPLRYVVRYGENRPY